MEGITFLCNEYICYLIGNQFRISYLGHRIYHLTSPSNAQPSIQCPRTIRKVNLPHPRQNLRIFQHSYTNVVNCHYWFFIYTHMFTYKYVAHRRQKCTSYYQWQLSSNQKPLLPCKLPPLSIYLSILLNRLGHRKPTLQKTNTCTTLSQLSICDTFSCNIGSYLSAKSWVMHARQVSRKQNTTTLLQITTRRAREHKNTK